MKYAVISDIHANETALRAVLDHARRHHVDRIICLGDVVGYGPLPSEALELVRESCAVTLAGNHDDAVSGRGDDSTFIDLAKDAVERHRAALSSGQLDWLRKLPYTCSFGEAVAAHGDVFDPPKFYYILDEKGAEANFAKSSARLIFVGHTHEPALFLTGRSGRIYKTGPQDFTLEDCKRYIVNPGSVGYPRDVNGQCLSSYVIYDSTERSVTFRYVPFQVSSVMQRGVERRPRLSRRLAIALSAVAAAVVATVVWCLLPRPAEGPAAPLRLAEKTLALEVDCRQVSANLTLKRESDPVQLRLVFRAASGAVTGEESVLVRKNSRKGFDVPSGSATATFTLERPRPGAKSEVVAFEPATIR